MEIRVKGSGGGSFIVEVDDPEDLSTCRGCGASIVWGRTGNGKSIPLQPWPDGAMYTETHFGHCSRSGRSSSRRHSSSSQLPPPPPQTGITMTEKQWRNLLLLVHPDKHHGGASEAVANDVTRWLLEQRARVKREG